VARRSFPGKGISRKAYEHPTRVSSRMDSHRIRSPHSHLRAACLSRRGFNLRERYFLSSVTRGSRKGNARRKASSGGTEDKRKKGEE